MIEALSLSHFGVIGMLTALYLTMTLCDKWLTWLTRYKGLNDLTGQRCCTMVRKTGKACRNSVT